MIFIPIKCFVILLIAGICHSQRTKWGPVLRIFTLLNEPLAMQNDCDQSSNSSCDENHQLKGFSIDFLDYLTKRVQGMQYRIKLVEDNKYGMKGANGSWNGLIGAIQSGKADAAIADIARTSEREEVADFTEAFMKSGISIMMKKPYAKCRWLTLLQPFTLATWICILAANLIFVAVALVLCSLLMRPPAQQEAHSEAITDATYNCLQYTPLTIVRQELFYNRGSTSLRVANLVWWIFMLFVVAAYIANLSAILAERNAPPIVTVNDLASQSRVHYGILKGGSTQKFFETTNDPLYRRLWAVMNQQAPHSFVDSYPEGIQRVRNSNGKFAFFLEEAANDYANRHYPCDTYKLDGTLNDVGYHVVLQKGSRFKEFFNNVIKEMKSNGEMAKLQRKWFEPTNECTGGGYGDEGTDDSLSMAEMAVIFIALLLGIIIVIAVAAFEFISRSKKRNSVTRL